MEQKEFTILLRDVVTHLYDYTVMETHPLTAVIVPPASYQGSRGQYLRNIIAAEIEYFKPANKPYDWHAVEWRPYIILQQRYLEGLSLGEISKAMALSERQIRRDTSRVLQALAGRLWDQLADRDQHTIPSVRRQGQVFQTPARQTFDIQPEILLLETVIGGVASVMERRLVADGLDLRIITSPEQVRVMADRVVTRQILISLLSYLFNFSCQSQIDLRCTAGSQFALISIQALIADPWSREDETNQDELLSTTRFWGQQIAASIDVHHPVEGATGEIRLEVRLPVAEMPVILVVDDQKPTQQMFRRFLSRKPYQVVGVTEPDQVLALARQICPVLITLDVMMPKMDGWEILQALKTDEQTRSIPVMVCSAWEEPELAKSLGAAAFLKKPVRQQDLLAALDELEL